MKHPIVDEITSCYGMIDVTHLECHKGNLFTVGALFRTVADNTTRDIYIATGANELHLAYLVKAGADSMFSLFEGVVAPTAGGVLAGTALVSRNKNREDPDDTDNTFYIVASLVSTGTMLINSMIEGGSKNFSVGGEASSRNEWVLKPNTTYDWRLENISGANTYLATLLEYYKIQD